MHADNQEKETKQNTCETGVLETAGFHAGVKAAIPFVRITGKKAGPTMTVMAGQHGRELNGIEVIRQVIMVVKSDPSFRGCCTFIPIANPPAVRMRQQNYPYEAESFNMNRAWPGRDGVCLHEQIARTLWDNVISRSQVCIDLHGWPRRMLAMGANRDTELVRSFGLENHRIHDDESRSDNGMIIDDESRWDHGMLGRACFLAGIASLTVELPPQNILSHHSIEAGTRGVLNIMRKTDMLSGELQLPAQQIEFTNQQEIAVKAECAGLFVPRMSVSALIRKGESLGEIVSLDCVLDSRAVLSPIDGVLLNNGPVYSGHRHAPESLIVDKGETIAQIREMGRIIENHRDLPGGIVKK